jgi:hypothetical protein
LITARRPAVIERRLDVSIYVSPASRTGYSVWLRGRWAC